ncbi:MAG: Gfo/Idh/MocA family oxidoreductase [Bacillota bacterium]|nr:Gfo/Idh/MocA family oxidoreductase [Bacillota bacterium]
MVVGYGAMGANHARVLAGLKEHFALLGIVDTDPARRAAARQDHPTVEVTGETQGALDGVEAVVIATPPATHYQLARSCLEANKHCLVEKPLALVPRHAVDLADAAERAGVVLQVGHSERYNPAVEALLDMLSGEQAEILAVSAERLSPPASRPSQVDIIHDLMIHDLEIAHSLVGGQFVDVLAAGFTAGPGADYASAILRCRGGQVVTLTASRCTTGRVRKLRVTTLGAHYELDYRERTITVGRRAAMAYRPGVDSLGLVQSHTCEVLSFSSQEPLARQAADFACRVRDGARPRVGARTCAAVLELAARISSQVGETHATGLV